MGGGCRSCCQSERDRSERNAAPVISDGADCVGVVMVSGYIKSRYGWIEESISVGVVRFNDGWEARVSTIQMTFGSRD
jgi:hypothetical protein